MVNVVVIFRAELYSIYIIKLWVLGTIVPTFRIPSAEKLISAERGYGVPVAESRRVIEVG